MTLSETAQLLGVPRRIVGSWELEGQIPTDADSLAFRPSLGWKRLNLT